MWKIELYLEEGVENDVSMSVHSIAENSINTVQIITKYMHDILSKKQDDPTLSSNTRCVKELTSIDEIYRPTDVLCIGDIHGNIEILEKNLESIGAINSSGEWMWGNKRLVLLGDIIGDRGVTGLACMRTIFRLRNSSREEGGDISVLAGNHEDIAISFLTERPIAGTSPDKINLNAFTNARLSMQGFGIIEFARDYFIKDIDIWPLGLLCIRNHWKKILSKMRQDPEGCKMLENICQMKIAEQIDDTLFVHTNLTSEMSQMICLKGIDWINTSYQDGLRDLLLGDMEPSLSYQEVADIFLHVDNRHYLNSNEAMVLKRQGINRVIHGHVDKNGTLEMIGEVEVCSVDFSAGKGGENMSQRSIGVIKRDSDVKLGLDAEHWGEKIYMKCSNNKESE